MTTVSVTAAHIAKGVRGSCSHCPIALALADAFPDANVYANGATFDIFPWVGDEIRLELPAEAEEFLLRFDDDGFGEPFTFNVNYPEAAA